MGENPSWLGSRPHPLPRKALNQLDFLVVQDIFLTETAELADVVFPGGLLRRKRRHVHQHRTAGAAGARGVEPPGEGRRSDWRIVARDLSNACGYPLEYSGTGRNYPGDRQAHAILRRDLAMSAWKSGRRDPGPVPRDQDHKGTQVLQHNRFPEGPGPVPRHQYRPPTNSPSAEYPLHPYHGKVLRALSRGQHDQRSKGAAPLWNPKATQAEPRQTRPTM